MNRVGQLIGEVELCREQLLATKVHLDVHMNGAWVVSARVDGQELDLTQVVGRLRAAQETLRPGRLPAAASLTL